MSIPDKCPRCGAGAAESNKHNALYRCGTRYFGPDRTFADVSIKESVECKDAQIARLRGVLERLTEWNRRYFRAVCVCYWCGEQDEYGHAPDCAWSEARKILEEK